MTKKCARCGSSKDLVIHHRDGFHGLFFPNDIVILCRKCHGEIHGKARCGKLDEVKQYFCYDKVYEKLRALKEAEGCKMQGAVVHA